MRKAFKRGIWLFLMTMIIFTSVTGCKASKKKVLESSYYKALQKELKQLKKENKKLKESSDSQKKQDISDERTTKYLERIARDKLVKLEVGFADNMEGSEFVENEAVFTIATEIAEKADQVSKYTVKQLEKEFKKNYTYILYDENNAIYEIYIYGKNYVVFADLPNLVFYAPDANALGDAFMPYRFSYPASNLMHRMADSPIVTDSNGYSYLNNVSVDIATYIDTMEKKKSNRNNAENTWKKAAKKKNKSIEDGIEPESTTYTFCHHGNTIVLVLYDKYISIKNIDGKRTWYKVSKKQIKEIKNIFKDDRNNRDSMQYDNVSTEASDQTSHSKEIESESDISQ